MELRTRHSQGGYTLIEVLAASMISLALLLLVGTIFTASNHLIGLTYTSFMISRDLSLGVEELRRDLKETALGTLRVKNDYQPSLTLVNAYTKEGQIQIDAQGAPDWQGWTHYVLERQDKLETGVLSKWVEYPTEPMPYPILKGSRPPLPIPSDATKKVVLRDVVFPDSDITDGKGKPIAISDRDGFSVHFLRRTKSGSYQRTEENPAVNSASPDAIDGNTRLLEVTVRTFTRSTSGTVNTVGLKFRVCPRY